MSLVYEKNPSAGGGGETATPYYQLVATSAEIDLTAANGDVTLYTVPAGEKFKVVDILEEDVLVDSINQDANGTFGTNGPSYDDIVSFYNQGGKQTGRTRLLIGSMGSPTRSGFLSAGESLVFHQTASETGTSLTQKFYVLGLLLDA